MHCTGADLDVLLTGPSAVTREMFFEELCGLLAERDDVEYVSVRPLTLAVCFLWCVIGLVCEVSSSPVHSWVYPRFKMRVCSWLVMGVCANFFALTPK